MRILLDENFPLQLYRRLNEAGYDVEHIIALGLRGLPDEAIRLRLAVEANLLFLTQDTEFAELPAATVLISRVPQAFPIARRVELWEAALDGFLQHRPSGWLFEVLADGQVVGWEMRDLGR